jgi:hypothetical protein
MYYPIGLNKASEWLTENFILGYFGGNNSGARNSYRDFVEDLLDKEYDSPLKQVIASTILGRPEFVSEITGRKLGEAQDVRNVPAIKELAIRPSVDDIIARVQKEPVDQKLLRNISIYCCRQLSGARLREIGAYFGISDAAVSQVSRRLTLKCEKDHELKQVVMRLEAEFKSVRS